MSPHYSSSGREAYKTVYLSLRQELVERIEKVREAKQGDKVTRISLASTIEDLLVPELERNEVLRRYAPFLEPIGVVDNVITIRDNRLMRIVELRVKEGKLYCDLDRGKSCVHIGFAWSIPKVYKVMKEHGSRGP